jgi:N-acetylmuramoyl-L-alanine amidase
MAGRGRLSGGRITRLVLAVATLLALGAAATAAVLPHDPTVGVLKVRLGGDQTQTRIVIELDHAATGKLLSPDSPSRQVAIALPKVEVAGGDMSGPGAGLVKSWSIDQAAGAARIRLELTKPAQIRRRFLLPPGDGLNVYRYVIDVATDALPTLTVASAGAAKPAATPVNFAPAALPPADPNAKKVIVIDAGHGGKDPGAHGADKHEKDLTLAAAHALRDRLERTGRYKVVLTRDTDVFIPLEQRVQIARRANADLFISLHADSGGDPTIRGATVYTLSEKGTDRVQHGVFDKSNWFMNIALPGQDAATKRILLDLTQRETMNRSSVFAELVLDKIGDKVELLRRSHRDAGFMVLLAPEVPAVLMEMGFITNAEDERVLADPERRKALMNAVSEAIDAYFTEEAKYAMR